jgi:hypothetical protein
MDRRLSHRFHLKLQSMPLTDIRDVLGSELQLPCLKASYRCENCQLNRRTLNAFGDSAELLRCGNKLITGCALHTVNVTQGRWN